jgi:N-methylhydantoinase B/oxoprolinase/acetone carboxylase alpha subunit
MKKRNHKYPQPESVSDFKARIAALMRGTTEPQIIGARASHPSLVRKPTDRGYYPPTKKGK